ncbi:hypothetical protein [Aneurinibacillus terranovensis]|uniref:hypothetical protein n=1 Tax=Aneurinibacillus terranovensis TaxID=278991 RepID=UPI00041B9D50|nr:hypothetical protein [Aneurinibacillus terranovensis]
MIGLHEILKIGPFMVNRMYGSGLVSFVMVYIGFYLFYRNDKTVRTSIDSILTYVAVIFLVVLKMSPVLLSPSLLFNNLSDILSILLYTSPSQEGMALALFTAFAAFLRISNKEKIPFQMTAYNLAFFVLVFTIFFSIMVPSSGELLTIGGREYFHPIHVYRFVLSSLLLVLLVKKRKANFNPLLGVNIFIAFCLGQLVISLFQPSFVTYFGLTIGQWMWIVFLLFALRKRVIH